MKPFTLGYVGVGLMGGPMVKRLSSLGWSVKGYDIVPERSMTRSAAEAARDADVVLLNLPTNAAVKDAVFRDDGVASVVSAKQLIVDFSTIPVDECHSHAERLLKQTGCRWVDAPVSGGPPAVEAGSLTVMAGGDEKDIERLRPLMEDIAGRCTRMGPVGAGLAAKMINQLVVGVGHAMLAESVALCEKAGIDAARIPECLGGGYADSNLMKAYWPRMVSRDFAPRGYVRQLLKGPRDGERLGRRDGRAAADAFTGALPVPRACQARRHRARYLRDPQALRLEKGVRAISP
jgi:3-hydroxyisobutyrate dehydrogenase